MRVFGEDQTLNHFRPKWAFWPKNYIVQVLELKVSEILYRSVHWCIVSNEKE